MHPDIRTWLYDILNVIDEIKLFTESVAEDFTLYEKDLKTRRAVERSLSIIGEAMNRISKKDPAIELTDIRLIIATRNRIIHGYETISNGVIWQIIQDDLPVLRKEVEALMNKV
jgi:uncharacterized protein with HEPN domain